MIELIYKIYYEEFYSDLNDLKKKIEVKDKTEILNIDLYASIEESCLQMLYESSINFLSIDIQEKFKSENISSEMLKSYIDNFDMQNKSYKFFFDNLKRKYSLFTEFIFSIIVSYINDSEELKILSQHGKMKNISISHGDSHNRGKTVAIIELDNENKIVYKPKDLKTEQVYYSLLENLGKKLNINIKTPLIIRKRDYSWQEFIEYNGEITEVKFQEYFYNLGVQTFLLYLLNANDIHYENLIISDEQPIIIDLETILQPSIMIHKDIQVENPIADTVIQTLLFDYSVDKENVLLFTGGTTNRSKYYPEQLDSVKNIPKNSNNEFQEIYNFKNELFEGFKDAYLCILKKDINIENLIENLQDIEVRIILRPTYVYGKYLEYFKQYNVEPEVKNILKNSITLYKDFEIIANHEYKSLINLDVPYFLTNFKSNKLYTSDKQVVIENFFNQSPYDNIKKKISLLSIKDMNSQLSLMEMAIDCYRENVDDSIELSLKKRNIPVIDQIFEEFIDTFSSNNNILNIQHSSNGDAILTPISYDIYYGLAGVNILLKYYNKLCPDKVTDQVIKNIEVTIDQKFKLDESLNFSIYHGRFSYFKYKFIISRFFNTPFTIEKELADLLNQYTEFLKEPNSLPLDYIGGGCGILSFICDVYLEYGFKSLLKYIRILTLYIVQEVDPKNSDYNHKDILTLGFAHGISGMLLSLSKAFKILGDINLNNITLSEYLIALLHKENKLLDKKEDINNIWCNGLGGIFLVRKILLDSYSDIYINENLYVYQIQSEIDKHKNEQTLSSLSVCHGEHGNQLIKKIWHRDFNEENRLINYTLSHEWSSGYRYPNKNFSFFLGITGQLFNIIYIDTDDKDLIKSIMC